MFVSHFASSEIKFPDQGLVYLGYLMFSFFLLYYFILLARSVACLGGQNI
jgi:hypothetical protein